MSLLVSGTVALDDIKTGRGVKENLLGGSAAHFTMSASLFTRVHLSGIVGEDFPRRHLNLLKRKGADLSSLQTAQGKTFHWTGEYDEQDWNSAVTLNTELGVLQNYCPQVTPQQRRLKYVFLANDHPLNQLAVLEQMAKPKLVGLDSMNLWITTAKTALRRLLKRVDLFVANDGEARMLTGESNLIRAAKALRKMGPEMVAVKKGEHGVIFYCDRFLFVFSAFPVERVIDPTGAGDTFAGGMMGYLTKSGKLTMEAIKQACLYATTCSSFNVEGYGASRTSRLTMDKVNRRMKQLVQYIHPVK
ncbi:MAG: PfkB family carbohydrate kinase [Candidatus Omnitrophota bacterium]